ncbi:MAG TPA: translesion DNA synthesis-associated protein ImuA [Chromatiales bacterium]|nr:translesion DNA synthesis-associated protein ImuA [Chromatiales bacterium]
MPGTRQITITTGMSSTHRIERLLEHPDIWRASSGSGTGRRVLPTGFAELDRACAGGWPVGALTELLSGEQVFHSLRSFRLLVPALRMLTRDQHRPGRVVLIDPPCIPYAPGFLAEGLDLSRILVVWRAHRAGCFWSMEQALRSKACEAVIAWCESADMHGLRRLQLAAEVGTCLAVLFRPEHCQRERSPAALRACVKPGQPRGMSMELIRRRGGSPRQLFLDA